MLYDTTTSWLPMEKFLWIGKIGNCVGKDYVQIMRHVIKRLPLKLKSAYPTADGFASHRSVVSGRRASVFIRDPRSSSR